MSVDQSHQDRTAALPGVDARAAFDALDLGETIPIASGTYRDVYPFPGQPGLVVKVLRAGAAIQPGRPIRNFLKSRSVRQRYRFMFREYEAYLCAKLAQAGAPGPLPITELFWLQQTNLGLGMVAERVRGRAGETARSLGALHRANSFGPDHLNALNAFIGRIEALDIVANDTNPENVLLDEAGSMPRFVLVDGFGDPNPIPFKRLSPRLRQRARQRRWVRMADFLGLRWNSDRQLLEH